ADAVDADAVVVLVDRGQQPGGLEIRRGAKDVKGEGAVLAAAPGEEDGDPHAPRIRHARRTARRTVPLADFACQRTATLGLPRPAWTSPTLFFSSRPPFS